MLRIPSFDKLGDLTIYQDDAVWTRFYLVPSLPRIRRDANGRPVFLLTVFHTSDQHREETEGAPRGGGFMNFDVEFAVDAAADTAAREKLQSWVDDEYARRKADPQYSSLPEYADAEAPRIEITDPLLSGGTVKMHTTQSALLVSGRLAEAPASLVSGSTAVFNLDLTETGAGFMKELFVDTQGEGRIDLTPVQVIYDLQMWARLPPVQITVTGDSQRIHKTLQSVSQQHGDNICTPAEIETFRETAVNSSTLRETGAVEVKIDKGDATVSEDVVQALQDYALELFDTMIAERFLVPADGETEPLEFDERGDQGAARMSAVRRRPWRSRAWGTTTGRYKVQETLNEATMHLEIKIDRSQVVEWPTGGQGTLQTFFADASAEELKRHVVELTADDFNSLGLTVQAYVDFAASPVQAVEVHVEYAAVDSNGELRSTPGAHTFDAGNAAPWRFDPTLIEGKREYRSRWRVIYDDGSVSDFTEWTASQSRALNIAVADPGRLALEVSAASLNWDVLRGIRADLSYSDPADAAAGLGRSFELTKLNPVRKWEQAFNRPLRGSVNAKVTYFLADDKVVEGTTQTIDATHTLYLVPPPQVDVLNVTLVPAGNWSDVAQAVVQMKYDAGDGTVFDRVFRFTAIEQSAEWAVLLRDSGRRGFSYQTVVSYKNGARDESPWQSKSGDQALLIDVKGVPKLKVNVLSNLVDFARTPAVQITLTYAEQRRTLAFTEKQAQAWEVPLAADGMREYAYEIIWHPASGDSISSGVQRSADTELFIPRVQLPTVGKLEVVVRGFAVNFAITPFVDVALVWTDDSREERKTVTLSKEQPNAAWSVDIGDRTQRRYRYAITYNLADGTRAEGASGETDDPVISVVRHQA